MSLDDSVNHDQPSIRTDYRNPNAGMPRRFASLWAQSEMLGWIGGFYGLLAGALPRTVEAMILARRVWRCARSPINSRILQSLPPPNSISALRLITMGAISTGAAIGVPLSLVPTNLLIFDALGINALLRHIRFDTGTGHSNVQYSLYNAETLVAATVGWLSMMSVQKKIDLKLAARGLPIGGPAQAAGLALGLGGLVLGGVWRERKAHWQENAVGDVDGS
ncbi:hypothetical protein C8F01DRAFT_1158566 [Mycena amicta]|nr:hypothetical protein C8F01DRAFT_1158566 [Mycena amicta]